MYRQFKMVDGDSKIFERALATKNRSGLDSTSFLLKLEPLARLVSNSIVAFQSALVGPHFSYLMISGWQISAIQRFIFHAGIAVVLIWTIRSEAREGFEHL